MRLQYSPFVRIIKIMCTGKIDAILLLRALEDGADLVYVAGCAMGDCHFLKGNYRAKQWVAYTKKLLKEIGMEPDRVHMHHVPASMGPKFAQVANDMTELARKLGPSPFRKFRSVQNKATTDGKN
jgi:F420-non-reducing hydrogenase iron-sulfur subunit